MKSIRRKLWFGMMILVGIIILLLWLFQIVFLEKFYSVLELREVLSQANQIENQIEKVETLQQVVNTVPIIESIDNFVYEKQISLQIINEKHKIVYEIYSMNSKNIPKMMKESITEVAQQALLGNESKTELTHPKFGYQFVIMAMPIYHNKVVEGAMIVMLPMASLQDTADILKKQLILITVILLIVAIIISFQLAKNFSKPIVEISSVAESFAHSNFEARVEKIGLDEIGQLATRMNGMGEALSRNELLQKEIIANVSHELRTPLALIRGYAETLRDVTGANSEKREKQLGIIIEETERLGILIEDMLNLSQLQSGAITLEQRSFSLNDLLYRIYNRFGLKGETTSFAIHGMEELKDNLYGDKNRIEQVFYNLIQNAFRYTKEDGIVLIVIRQTENHVRIEVKDNGEGIMPEDLGHVFERYYKGKRSGNKKEKSTGLGLAIVKNILELHKVPYGVESKVNIGTTFWFELPKDRVDSSL
ncbi:MAG: ATP-binding protein [Velocimicrobium sp.]